MSKHDGGQLDGVVYKGVLEKVARLGFNSKRLCVLSESQFGYFSDQKAQGTLKQILLKDVQAVKRDHSCKGFQFEIITEHRTELFAAASLEQLEHWVRILQSSILNTRRNSVPSYSRARKSGLHKYEEVDIDEQVKQPRISRSGLASKSAFVPINGYEEIDINVGSTPKLVSSPSGAKGKSDPQSPVHSVPGSSPTTEPRSPRVTINTYETIGIKPDSSPKLVTEATVGSLHCPPQALNETLSPEPPVYSLAKHVPRYSNSNNEKSLKEPVDKQKLPAQRGVCTTVDSHGGPPPTKPLRRPQFKAPHIQTDEIPPNYSEAVTKKRSDLYAQVKETKLGQGEVANRPNNTGYTEVPKDDCDLYSRVNKFRTYEKDREKEPATYSSLTEEPATYSPVAEEPATYSSVAEISSTYSSVAEEPMYSSMAEEPTMYSSVGEERAKYSSVGEERAKYSSVGEERAKCSSVSEVTSVEAPQFIEVISQSTEMEIYNDGKSTKESQYENVFDEDVYDEAQSSNTCNNPPLSESSSDTSHTEKRNSIEGKKARNGKLPISGYKPDKNQADKTTAEILKTTSTEQIIDQTESDDTKRNEDSTLSDDATHTPDFNDLVSSISEPTPVASLRYGPLKKHKAIRELEKYMSLQQINTFRFSFLTRESSNEAIRKLKTFLEQM